VHGNRDLPAGPFGLNKSALQIFQDDPRADKLPTPYVIVNCQLLLLPFAFCLEFV